MNIKDSELITFRFEVPLELVYKISAIFNEHFKQNYKEKLIQLFLEEMKIDKIRESRENYFKTGLMEY